MSEWVEYLLKLLAKVDDAEQAQEDDEVLIPEDYKGLTQKALQQLIDLDEGKHAQLYDTLSELQVRLLKSLGMDSKCLIDLTSWSQ